MAGGGSEEDRVGAKGGVGATDREGVEDRGGTALLLRVLARVLLRLVVSRRRAGDTPPISNRLSPPSLFSCSLITWKYYSDSEVLHHYFVFVDTGCYLRSYKN